MDKDNQRWIDELAAMHHPEAIARRLEQQNDRDYLADAVLGGIDGCVTTFAIVAGTMGGGFDPLVALALGLSNLIADGFSMAISNYQATKSVHTRVQQARKQEEEHIELIPEGEREEIRQMYKQKGFSGETLEEIVKVITSDNKIWVDTMLQEEYGLPLQAPSPLRSAWVTFVSFCIVGLMPLLPFFFLIQEATLSFKLSCLCTAMAFVGIGVAKGWVLKTSMIIEGFEMLIFGSMAASMAYAVSYWVAMIAGNGVL